MIDLFRKIFIGLFLLVPFRLIAQQDSAVLTFRNPFGIHTPHGYSHMAVVDLGNCRMLILSGQVALDSTGQLVGKDQLALQATQAFTNIQTAILSTGGSMSDLVKLTFFLKDVSQIQALREVRDRFINVDRPPTSTLVEVKSLFRPDILIEIEATAIVPKK